MKRSSFHLLGDKQLVEAYTDLLYRATIPENDDVICMANELGTRARAARALLLRVADGSIDWEVKGNEWRTAKQKSTRRQVRYAVGYETVLRESKWLVGHKDAEQSSQSRKLIEEMEGQLPRLRAFYREIVDKPTSRGTDDTFSNTLASDRKRASDITMFPETITFSCEKSPGSKSRDE